jgi:Autographiviridae endonuclease
MPYWSHTPIGEITRKNGVKARIRKQLSWDQPECVRYVFDSRHQSIQRNMITPCWEWTGHLDSKGYGRLRVDGKTTGAHRISWVLYNSPITSSDFICHRCDNPPCVNPLHLFKGTNIDNVRDAQSKNRYEKVGMPGTANPSCKLSQDDVMYIREHAQEMTGVELSKKFSISRGSISNIILRRTWRHI